MWSAYLFQTVTGLIGPKLQFESLSWNIDLNDTESINVTLNKSDLPPVNRSQWFSPWWAGVALFWDNKPIVAGPIIDRPTESKDTVSISCGGIRSLLAKRIVVHEQSDWSKISGTSVRFEKMSLGTIAKEVVKKSMMKPSGALPIIFAVADETSAMGANHERTYQGFNVDNINCDEILTKLSNVIDGPDIMFRPVMVRDNSLAFEMWTGTEKEPRIYQNQVPVWDLTAPESGVVDLRVVTTGAYQTMRTFSVGAGQDEGTLIRVNTNEGPLNLQYPLLETTVNTSESEDPKVVDQHGVSSLWANKEPLSEIQMTIRGDGVMGFGDFWPGDLVEVVTEGWIAIPDGVSRMRLLSMTGSSDNEVRVSLQMDDRYS